MATYRFANLRAIRCQNPCCKGEKTASVHWNGYLEWHICETCSQQWRAGREGQELFAVAHFKYAAYDGQTMLANRGGEPGRHRAA